MSTRIHGTDDEGAPYVTRFAGGVNRGICYQIDDTGNYITLTTEQAEKVAKAILKDIKALKKERECTTP